MAKEIVTCGCTITEANPSSVIEVKSLNLENKRVRSIMTMIVCQNCREWWQRQGYILTTEAQKKAWLK